ncbi:deoxyuridine triphosphatase [Dermatophagoides farinae]|uniref:deoxyuridine triphosphatase n=1 Tax=Dermatophagoides farinae TaxID=6954 RepID=UPI003F60B45C
MFPVRLARCLTFRPNSRLFVIRNEKFLQQNFIVSRMVTDTGANKMVLKIKRLSADARLPTRGSKLAAGYDLYAAHDAIIPARGKIMIKTDISIQIPSGYYGRVAPRSGLALKNSIDIGAGVIDEDYRGNVGVIIFNHGDQAFTVTCGDRIAQLLLEKIITPEVIEVDELDTTERNAGGFGSTGVSSSSSTA